MTERCILFISKGESRASTRYRALDFFPLFVSAGWKVRHRATPRNLMDRLALLKAARQADVVVVLRKPFAGPYRGMLRRAARRLVFDLDDAIFLNDDGEPSGLRMRRFSSMARHCDLIWAGNAYLAERCRPFCDRVLLAPTSVAPNKYDVQAQPPSDSIDLVWIGSRSTRKYLDELLPTLEAAASQIKGLRLKIIADFDMPSDRLVTLAIPWSVLTEAKDIASSHIGLAPLPDDPWTRGKCGLKTLQYMAAGLPVVASASGVHPEMIENDRTGLLVDTPEEWIEALVRLSSNDALRQMMGQNGRMRVIEHYSLEATFKTLTDSLELLWDS